MRPGSRIVAELVRPTDNNLTWLSVYFNDRELVRTDIDTLVRTAPASGAAFAVTLDAGGGMALYVEIRRLEEKPEEASTRRSPAKSYQCGVCGLWLAPQGLRLHNLRFHPDPGRHEEGL